jgi:hypothetical protein
MGLGERDSNEMMGTMSGKSWEEGEQRKRYRCKGGCVGRGRGDLVQSLLMLKVFELCKFQWALPVR